MNATTYAWLVLGFPLAGSVVIALGWRGSPVALAGWIGSAAIGIAFLNSVARCSRCRTGRPRNGI